MIKLLDWERALENVDGSQELLLELAKLFIESCPDMMRQIRDAIIIGDAPALHRAAHNIKGSARIFAAGAVVNDAMRLEAMGAENDLSKASECFAALESSVSQLSAALAERIGRTGAGEKKGL
ncbi:MAG TPA: Hpt domain-containing protein [Rhizorhapis sp.]|nr:Hpt domain-containing protein [Rhizorhapis sp.]